VQACKAQRTANAVLELPVSLATVAVMAQQRHVPLSRRMPHIVRLTMTALGHMYSVTALWLWAAVVPQADAAGHRRQLGSADNGAEGGHGAGDMTAVRRRWHIDSERRAAAGLEGRAVAHWRECAGLAALQRNTMDIWLPRSSFQVHTT
jgi:hypothetical protein